MKQPRKRAVFYEKNSFTVYKQGRVMIEFQSELMNSSSSAPCQKWPFRPEGGVQMSKYEVMYIINANVDEEKRTALIEQLNGIITSEGGKIVRVDEWGMKEFAYEIDDMTKGYYVIVTFEAENEALNEFDRLMRINPSVVRFMIVNIDDKPEPKESK